MKITEHIAFGITDPRAIAGTIILTSAFEKTPGRQAPNEYDRLAREMALVCTPYAPCTDLRTE